MVIFLFRCMMMVVPISITITHAIVAYPPPITARERGLHAHQGRWQLVMPSFKAFLSTVVKPLYKGCAYCKGRDCYFPRASNSSLFLVGYNRVKQENNHLLTVTQDFISFHSSHCFQKGNADPALLATSSHLNNINNKWY
eukprot:m.40638 g.40638  ORF g.40638 m.40638 type:complete len:140 (+) comp6937_c1_seq1:1231-1650(+)